MNAIEIKDLRVKYENFYLNNINLKIPTGSIVGLIGKNGAGKTTLINAIMNIIKAESGEIKVLGVDNKSKEFVEAKENIGVVLDQLGIHEYFTINEVNKFMNYAYKDWDMNKFINILEKFEAYTNKKIKDYSTGMKKKLAIAIALGHSPDLLILDEPTANLDPFARDEILDYLYDYTRDENKTILISSHILSDLEKLCDYIIYINDGRIILYDSKDEILEKYGIIKVSKGEYEAIDKDTIIFEEENNYGYELLVYNNQIPDGIKKEYASLDDIIVRLVKSKKNFIK